MNSLLGSFRLGAWPSLLGEGNAPLVLLPMSPVTTGEELLLVRASDSLLLLPRLPPVPLTTVALPPTALVVLSIRDMPDWGVVPDRDIVERTLVVLIRLLDMRDMRPRLTGGYIRVTALRTCLLLWVQSRSTLFRCLAKVESTCLFKEYAS